MASKLGSGVWELRLEWEGNERVSTLFRVMEGSQVEFVASENWGPFDTNLEISQWVWKWLARSLARHND